MVGQMSRIVPYIVLAVFALTCSGRQHVQPKPLNSVDGGSNVLIVTRQSAFKERVVGKLIEKYRSRANLALTDIENLNDVRATDYDALVVMGARMGFLLLSAKERRFIRHLDDPKKLIMVMTASAEDWKWDRDDVDVITCASNFKNVEPLYQQISARLDELLVR